MQRLVEGPPHKVCAKCCTGFPADLEHFYANGTSRRDGLDPYCKECRKACSRSRSKRAVRDTWLRRDYGITVDEFDQLAALQGGVCRICRRSPQGKGHLSVDHNGTTKVIRGLLCDPCNRAIGMFHHDPDRIREAARYLEEAVDVIQSLRLLS